MMKTGVLRCMHSDQASGRHSTLLHVIEASTVVSKTLGQHMIIGPMQLSSLTHQDRQRPTWWCLLCSVSTAAALNTFQPVHGVTHRTTSNVAAGSCDAPALLSSCLAVLWAGSATRAVLCYASCAWQ